MVVNRNKLHEVTVDLLLERLRDSGRYDTIRRGHWYDTNGFTGEMDVYATRGETHVYFEIKSTLCDMTLQKAQQQAFRVGIAHPHARWRHWLVLPPDGHPERWIHDPRPRLRTQRLTPQCHHLPPAKVLALAGGLLCGLCGESVTQHSRHHDVSGRARSDLVSAYSAYLLVHPRRYGR